MDSYMTIGLFIGGIFGFVLASATRAGRWADGWSRGYKAGYEEGFKDRAVAHESNLDDTEQILYYLDRRESSPKAA